MAARKLVLLAFLCAGAALSARSDSTKFAGRLFLSNGDVVEVVSTRVGGPAGSTETIAARFSSGDVLTVSDKTDQILRRSETRISDGTTTLEIFNEWGFYRDGLAVPLVAKMGESVYRALIKAPGTSEDQKRMQAAVMKLPASFVASLQGFTPIALYTSGTTNLSIPAFVYIEEIVGGRSGVRIIDLKKLDPAESDALVRDAAVGRRLLKSD